MTPGRRGSSSQDWGPWTPIKLAGIGKYLSGFTTATKKAPATLYLDLCAGSPANRERETGESFMGSAERALATDPPFSKLIFCELEEQAAADLDAHLRPRFPGRDFSVHQGDCNLVIPQVLADLPDSWKWAATFAFIDQLSAEVHWRTIQTLAAYRNGSHKVELCMYFGDSLIPRGLRLPGGGMNYGYADRVDMLFGDERWRQIIAAREDEVLNGAQTRDHLVNLMRWQLEEELGYEVTIPVAVRNTTGQEIYKLIFATDHNAGDKIMRSVFEGVEEDLDLMVRSRREKRAKSRKLPADDLVLFDAGDLYQAKPDAPRQRKPIEPPVEPFQYSRH